MKIHILFVFLLILLLQLAPVYLQAPNGGCNIIYNGEKCFNYHSGVDEDWNEAKAACALNELSLASVTSSGENDLIHDLLVQNSHEDCWIGFSDQFSEESFFWEDGSPVNYTNWGYGQPREESGNEDCTEITGNSKWFDVPCDALKNCGVCSSPVSPFGILSGSEFEAITDDSIITESSILYCVTEKQGGTFSIPWRYVDPYGESNTISGSTPDSKGISSTVVSIGEPGFYMCDVTQNGDIARTYHVALLEPAIYAVDPFGQEIGSYLFQPLEDNKVFTVSTTLYCVTSTKNTQQTVWKYTDLDSISKYIDSDTGSSTGVSVLRASIDNPGSYSCIVTLYNGSEQIYSAVLFPATYPVPTRGCDIITENGKCFELNEVSSTLWEEAQADCKMKGYNLATISSSGEQELIDSLITTTIDCYIGYNDLDEDDVFSWIDGSSTTYTNWGTNPVSSDCVTTLSEVWEPVDCTQIHHCHFCSSQVSQFGKLVGSERYTAVEDNSILTTTTILQCITEGGRSLRRGYVELGYTTIPTSAPTTPSIGTTIPTTNGPPTTTILTTNGPTTPPIDTTIPTNGPTTPPIDTTIPTNAPTTPLIGTDTLEINIDTPGYYSCEVTQDSDNTIKTYTVALLDPSIHTVVEAANSYTYTIDIDREEAFLFCHKWDNSVPFDDYNWRKSGTQSYLENPLDISSLSVNQNSYQMECFQGSLGTVILDVDILIQGPPVITLDTGDSTTSFDLLPAVVNEAYVNLRSQDLVLSINIVGKWHKPDDSYETESNITFENFELSDAGLYRFYVTNLEMEQTLAIQILLKVYQFGGVYESTVLYEALEDNTIITNDLLLYCVSGNPQIPVSWFSIDDGIRVDVTSDSEIDDIGAPVYLGSIGPTVSYVSCESVQTDGSILRHTVWFVNTENVTVVEASDSFSYTQNVDSGNKYLLCHKADKSVPFEYTIWRELGTTQEMENPLSILNLEIDGRKHKMQCLDSRTSEEILIIDLTLQGPFVLTIDSGSVSTYTEDTSFYHEINYQSQNVTLSVNLLGRWDLPDGSFVTESSITFPSFEVYNEGPYNFFVTNWEKVDLNVLGVSLEVYKFGQKIQDTYKNLDENTILTTSTILYCKTDLSSQVSWNYQNAGVGGNTEADRDPVTGISLLEVSIEDSGIYSCTELVVGEQPLTHSVGIFDPSIYTVADAENSFIYTTGVDSDNILLFCGQEGTDLLGLTLQIVGSSDPTPNPINIMSISSVDATVEISCAYLSESYSNFVYKQGPPSITLTTSSSVNYEDLIPDINTAYLEVNEYVDLQANLLGRWQLPDGSFNEESSISFPTFETSDQGLYKFYVISWENEHKLAIQIFLKVYPFGEIDGSNTHQSIEDNSILTLSTTLYCITETSVDNPQVIWSYKDLDNYYTQEYSETDPLTGISYLSISTGRSGYYSCVVTQDSGTITTYTIALLEPSVYTVAEDSYTYKYTEGVDSEETSLFCYKSDKTAEFVDVFWRERGTTDASRNPIHIGGLAAYRNDYSAECIDSSNNQTILVVDIMLQGPLVVTFDTGTVDYLTSLFPVENFAYVELYFKLDLTANVVGRWQLPDNNYLPENVPINEALFGITDQGLYKFYVIDWREQEVLAFQILIKVHEFGTADPTSLVLEDYSIITTDTRVYCTSETSSVTWRYEDFNGESEVSPSTAQVRSFTLADSGYHSCNIVQNSISITHTFALIDPTIYTVVEAAQSLTYTVGIDREIAFLFCHKPDNSVPFGEIGWREMGTDERKQNPINIADIPDDGNTHTMECLDALDDTPIFNVQILIQGPPVITLNTVSVVSYTLLPEDINKAYVDLLSQEVLLSVNLVGRWQLPDSSWDTGSSLTFSTFQLTDQGLYKFYVADLDNMETLAIQIYLTVNQFGEKIDSTTYGILSTNSILTANTDLYCLNGVVTWSYRDLAGISTDRTGTIDSTGASVLSVEIDNPGYYSCEVTQQPDGSINRYTVAVLDTTLLQVIETSESYLYTLGVENDIFLFCHKPDNSISSADIVWVKNNSFPLFKNPLDVFEVGNLFKYTDTYLMECLDETSFENILSVEISMQGPPVISVDTGTVETFESLASDGNTAYIIIQTQNVVMTANNLVGKWQRPDDTHVPDNSITFLSFDESDVGVYKFYVTDWYNEQKLAIQIKLSLSATYSQGVTDLSAVTSSDTSILVTWGLLAEQTTLSNEKFSVYYGHEDVYNLAGTTESLYFSITGLTLNFNYTIRVDLQFAYSTATYSETMYHSLMPGVLSTSAVGQSNSLDFLTQEKFLIAVIVLLLIIIIALFFTACLSALCVKRYLSKKARLSNPLKVGENETYSLEKIPDN